MISSREMCLLPMHEPCCHSSYHKLCGRRSRCFRSEGCRALLRSGAGQVTAGTQEALLHACRFETGSG
eukprot:6382965-Alexandrium_andersonii.AAC.1